MTVLRFAPVQGEASSLCAWSRGDGSLPCARSRGDVSSLCARSRGKPSSARCEQRLSDGSPLARAIPCAPAPECGVTREKANSRQPAGKETGKTMQPRSKGQPASNVCAPTRSAASRAGMAGWAGEGGGRFGERREYEAPTLPSTHRQHGSARHHTRQPNNRTAYPQRRHATTQASPTKAAQHDPPPQKPTKKRQSKKGNLPNTSQPRNTPTRPHTIQPNGPDTRTQTSPATPTHIPITTP